MLTNLSDEKNNSLRLELGDQEAGTIGGYCEDGFPIYYANEKIAHMLGYDDVDDLINGIDGKVANTIYPGDMDRVVKELNHGEFYEGMTYKVTYRMIKKDGTWIWTIDRGKVVRAEDGRLAILSVCNDMTDFIDEHTELERLNQISKSTLENMPGGYHQCACDKDYTFLYISERFLEMFGWTREEIKSEFDDKFINMLHPDDRQATDNYIDRINSSDGLNKVTDAIYRMRGKHGYVWVSDATSLVSIGDRTFYQGTLTDITDFVNEKKAQDLALREQLAIVNTLSSNYRNVYLANTNDGSIRILRIAKDYDTSEIFDFKDKVFSLEDIAAKWIASRVHPDDKERVMKALDPDYVKELFKTQDHYTGTYRSMDGGKMRNYQFDVRKVDDDGNFVIGFQIIDDIIEEQLKQQERLSNALAEAQSASKAKSTFLNNMSHDIRTPMNAIIGYTALAQSHYKESERVQDYLSKINTSSTHLLNLINEILDMSRIESGTVKLEKQKVHIPDLLQDLESMINGLVTSKHLNLIMDTQNLIHEDVITDKLRLNQILINIVGNAIKFTQSGGEIIVRLVEKPDRVAEVNTYEFTVQDNGIGMSKEFQSHIFDTFSREYTSTTSGIQGTGLGMAITKNIVDMMDGEIRVESEEGKGSVFTVILHLRSANELEEKETTIRPESYDYSDKCALLVEDNELNREIATAILEETGMTIHSVNDGDEAVAEVDAAPEDRYDLILMDIQMPKMDGYTATRAIRALSNEKKANLPIVAMTANAFEEDKRKAFAAGMNGHIAKPINMAEIAKVLDALF